MAEVDAILPHALANQDGLDLHAKFVITFLPVFIQTHLSPNEIQTNSTLSRIS